MVAPGAIQFAAILLAHPETIFQAGRALQTAHQGDDVDCTGSRIGLIVVRRFFGSVTCGACHPYIGTGYGGLVHHR